jgi:hypothetical protein
MGSVGVPTAGPPTGASPSAGPGAGSTPKPSCRKFCAVTSPGAAATSRGAVPVRKASSSPPAGGAPPSGPAAGHKSPLAGSMWASTTPAGGGGQSGPVPAKASRCALTMGTAACPPVSLRPSVRLSSNPSQATATRSGTSPTNQASRALLVVPVLPTMGRGMPLSAAPVPSVTTERMTWRSTHTTSSGSTCSGGGGWSMGWSSGPSASETARDEHRRARRRPSAASVAYALASSRGVTSLDPRASVRLSTSGPGRPARRANCCTAATPTSGEAMSLMATVLTDFARARRNGIGPS